MTLAFDASEFHLADSDIEHRSNHAETLAWRAAQVESKSAQAESKSDSIESAAKRRRTGQAAAEEARPVVERWVDVSMPRCGHKRMAAYAVVARMFEVHESLIRRLLGRQITRLDADFYKRVMSSEPDLQALLAARARADLARYAGSASVPTEEARDATQ